MRVKPLAAVAVLLLSCLLWQQALSQSNSLTSLLQQREAEVEQIVQAVQNLYDQSRCGEATCSSDVAACMSQVPQKACASSYGGCRSKVENRLLSFDSSVIRTATSPFSDDVRKEACWTRQLDSTFVTINGGTQENLDTATKWQYFGTPSGFYRIYPGVAQSTCHEYDPRLRPWYVAATSGPKDIVLVLDRSGSMATNNKWTTALEAADTVLETLTIADFVAVVVFDDAASQVCGDGVPCGSLVQATAANVQTLRSLLTNYGPDGSTNFEVAFESAFSILKQTNERTSGCHTAILFMTDGAITAGKSGNSFLNFVESEQDELYQETGNRAVMFTFSFGSGANIDIPKALACNHNGTWSPVVNNINLREQMGNYYDYFASLRAEQDTPVVWVEPYEDASGAGVLTTASKAIYDNAFSPPRLVGVVGIDILASDLEAVAPDYEGLLSALVQRSNACPTLDLQQCELNTIRTRDYSTNSDFTTGNSNEESRLCDPSDADNCTSPSAPPCKTDMNVYTQPSIPASDESHSHFGSSRSSYNNEACSSCATSSATQAMVAVMTMALVCSLALVF